ncbi:MAG: MSMEG_4193 family putative phosphomutase [Actinobacteria bacterium]|nr:MSMEG_4193 family putative phosphomutase [Actinomycetota bacterium]
MTEIILLRHAHSTANAAQILAGRTHETHLSETGRKQANLLVKRLGGYEVKALRSSPLIRCEETIAPWLRYREKFSNDQQLKMRTDNDLAEVDYGLWSGQKIKSLIKEPLWKVVQNSPSKVTFPQGESMIEMQERAMAALERALKIRGKGSVVLVSHGDILKSIVAGVLNMPFDDFQRIVIDPASLSVLDFSSSRPRVLLLNDSHSPLRLGNTSLRGKQPLIGGGSGAGEPSNKAKKPKQTTKEVR